MKFIKPSTKKPAGSWIISDENDEINVAYTKENCQGYLLEMNAYEKLVYLAGYNTIEKVENKEAPFSIVQDIISEKYGKEKAADFFKTMNNWYVEYNNNWQGEDVFNLAIKLEKLFLEFIKLDINNLKSENEAKAYIKFYEFYKTKNLPQVTDTISGEQITNEIFEINNIDELLYLKLQEINREIDAR